MPDAPPARFRDLLGPIAALTAWGAALRLLGMDGDFWLDEVWSWQLATGLSGAAGVFTEIHHSNNHHLVTLWMRMLGPDAPVWAYRAPSFVAGVASIPLAAALALPGGRRAALTAAAAVASCFALVHFSSEARGYALAVGLALAAQLLLRRALAGGPAAARARLGFGLCVSLGLLSHLGFAFYWAGAAAQTLWERRPAPLARGVRETLALHALPALVLAALWAVDLRWLFVGAGNPTDPIALATRVVAFGFGTPLVPWVALPVGAGVALAFAAALRSRARAGDARWIGDAVTVVLAPALVFAVFRPEVVAVRYFLIGLAFTLVALAEWLGPLRGRASTWLAVTGGLFLVGNLAHVAAFAELGRGGYREAVGAIAETLDATDKGRPARVSSDHDFRTGSVLRFHARASGNADRIRYVPQERAQQEGVDWWILHRASRPQRPRPQLRDAAGRRYRLFAEYDHAAISGFYWALYRLERSERSSTTTPKPSVPKGSAPKRSTLR